MNEDDLRRMLDEKEIVDLTHTYCWALDTRDFEKLRDVFIPDATARLRGEHTGIDEIIATISDALGPLDSSQHLVATHQISVDGDTATCRCYLQAQHVREAAEGGSQYIIAGRYEDQLVRTADGWKFSHRTFVLKARHRFTPAAAPPK